MRGLLASALILAGMGLPGALRAQVASVEHPFSPDAVQLNRSFVPLPRLPDTTRAWTMPVGPASDDFIEPGRPFRPHPGIGFARPFIPPNFFFSAVLWSPMFFPYMWDSPWDTPASEPAASTEGGTNHRLRRQMGRLTREIMKLRYYEEAENQVSPRKRAVAVASPAPAPRKLLPTVFVYRDGREFQATDYAIFGPTLWVFGKETATKIPLSALNLQASKKLNDARGINFVLPD